MKRWYRIDGRSPDWKRGADVAMVEEGGGRGRRGMAGSAGPMAFVSITRLRIRSLRFLPVFALQTLRTLRQVKRAEGFRGGALLPDRAWTFWTMTVWAGRDEMRSYMMEGAHRAVMPRLRDWCDEASVVHWEQAEAEPPTWEEADRRMREGGRASKVSYPSANHQAMSYRAPRVTGGGPIRPAMPRSE